jgi:hypothetical protein
MAPGAHVCVCCSSSHCPTIDQPDCWHLVCWADVLCWPVRAVDVGVSEWLWYHPVLATLRCLRSLATSIPISQFQGPSEATSPCPNSSWYFPYDASFHHRAERRTRLFLALRTPCEPRTCAHVGSCSLCMLLSHKVSV